MIDLNTLISNALVAAVQQATAPLNERIATLELQRGEMQRTIVLYSERIAALETKLTEANLFTQMVPTPSVLAAQYTPISNEQIKAALQEWATTGAFVTHLDQQEWFWDKLSRFVTSNSNTTKHIIDALSDTNHPLFKRLSSFMDAVAEQAMDHHLECYDHDNYDEMESKLDDLPDFDDFVKTDYLEDAVREAVSNLSFDISVS